MTSDHGEEFGEHNIFFHGHTLYRQTLHVPLMMLGLPVLPAGRRVTEIASLRDLPATVMSLLQLPDSFPGESLSRFWTGGVAASDTALSYTSRGIRIPGWLPSSAQDMRSLTTDTLHYIQGKKEMLFRWKADPEERSNLVDYEESRELVPRLRAYLRAPGSP